MQIKKSISSIFVFTIIFVMFFINNAFASGTYENPNLKLRVENFISKNDKYKIFSVHMKIYKMLQKLEDIDFEKNKYKQLLYIDEIIKKSIQSNIEANFKPKIESKIKEILKNKGEIIKDFKINNVTFVENKSYTTIWRIFYKVNVEYSNNGKSMSEFLNIYYNGDIGVYFRPQENSLSKNFIEKNISINLRNKKIVGTLSYDNSKKSQNLIIMTTGGGENDRDFLSSKHRINVVLSNYLNSLGYAVFRYDKSSIGASTGDYYMNITSLDLATDLDGVIKYFKTQSQLSIDKIGLLGHSEGGIISSIVASKNSNVSFLIILGAPYSSLEQILKDGSINLGNDYIGESLKLKVMSHIIALEDIIKNSNSGDETLNLIEAYKNSLKADDKLIFSIIEKNLPFGDANDLSSPWFKYYLTLDIKTYLEKIKIPTLVLNGDNDFIVDSTKMGVIDNIISNNNPKSELKILENTGHMLEKNTTRKYDDYSNQSEAVNPKGLEQIGGWLEGL